MSAAGSREMRVAVVGATGTVGSQIADLIGARDFPYAELKLFGSEAGTTSEGVESGGRTLSVARLGSPADLAPFDLALLAIPADDARSIIEAKPGPICIDLSAARRAPEPSVSMVAPGLTPRERLIEMKGNRTFTVPDPAAQTIAMLLKAIDLRAGFASAAVMIAASGDGREAVSELFNQSADLLNARLDIGEEETQRAFNVFQPANESEAGNAIAAQVAALVPAAPPILVEVLRVPAFHGSGIALFISAGETTEWAARLRAAPGVIMLEGTDVSSFVDAVGQEAVLVRMSVNRAGARLWAVFDGPRLAALSAIWIAETLAFVAS
jgi:aspartate-semialdehyde dehydrogenase